MKKIISLMLSLLVMMLMGFNSLNAEMKCGAGKCGAAMKAPAIEKPKACCQAKLQVTELKKACDCPRSYKCTCKDDKSCNCEPNAKVCDCPRSVECICED